MKIKILRGDRGKWYYNTDNIGKEFRDIEYIGSSSFRFLIKGSYWVDKDDCVITELPESFCVKRCDDNNRDDWKKYIDWLNTKYNSHIFGDVWDYYGVTLFGNSEGCKQSFAKELHIDDIIKHIDFYSEPMVIESKEEFDMSTNRGRQAYAIKYYPYGTKYRGLDLDGNVVNRVSKVTRTPHYNQYDNIDAGSDWIYIDKFNKWAEIINEVNEEPKMETNLLELIRLFPELPTDYAKKLVQKALEVKEGNLINLANFIGSADTPTPFYEIITGSKSEQKANYVWRKIYDFKNKKTNMETQKLSRQGLKEIHSVACGGWKEILEKYGTTNPLEDYIELTQEQVNTMFSSCTKEQLPIVSKYLKKDDGSVDVTKLKVDGKGFVDGNFYIIRDREWGEYKKQSFLLSQRYDWEIKTDDVGQLCLIPTKKK